MRGRNKTIRDFLTSLVVSILIVSVVSVTFPELNFIISNASASPSPSSEWFYSGWQYRKMQNITLQQIPENVRFFDISSAWTTISGNLTQRHAFQPVHNATIMEVNKVVDGSTWKYLAYDSNSFGSQIRLYYTNDTAGIWTPYSANPILSSGNPRYRWPSTTCVNGTFYMFLTNINSGTLERWTSVNGIDYVFVETIKTGGNQYKNPYIWNNPNDNSWYLYTHDSSGSTESIKVRHSSSIEDLDIAVDTVVVSSNVPFGSPTVTFYDDKYWLLAETQIDGLWEVGAYYSETSPSSGFSESVNSPILSNDDACPMLLLNPTQTKAYLFVTRNSAVWYQETREVYLNSTTTILSAAALANYQVQIKALYGSGLDNGENVYLNDHSRTDFGDVRFTWFNSSALSEVPINYWVEELKTAQSAVFWLKIPEISSTINNTIYVYYGKDDALSASNGTATFDFFDDFSGTLSKWTVVGGTWSIENGELNAQTTANPYGQRLRATNFSFGNNSVHVKIKWISGTYFEHGPFVRGQQPNEQTNGYMTYLSTWPGDSRNRISKLSSGRETTLSGQGTTNPSTNVWYTYVFSLYENKLKATILPLYQTEISGTDTTFSNGTLSLFSWSGASEHVYYDDLFVTKYADPEPSHSAWGGEETAEYVNIDQAVVSDPRADVGSVQKVSIHTKWNNNNSDVVEGTIFVNSTGYLTNATGWITFNANSSVVGSKNWIITGVNCGGVTTFTQTASIPHVIWDEIGITAGNVTQNSVALGENTTIWFKAIYEYDSNTFDGNDGFLYLNDTKMLWSSANNRWEYVYIANVTGATSFRVSQVSDNLYNLTMINDAIGNQLVTSWYSPFSIISNSTVSDIAFNSTSRVLSFEVSGLSGTTGFTNVTIAKTLISDISSLTVYVDGNQTNFNINDLTYSWLIHFTYGHSTHKVTIVLGSPPAESSTHASTNPVTTNPPTKSPSTYPSPTNPSSVNPSTNSSSVDPLSITPSLPNLPFNPITMALSITVATIASAILILELFKSRRSDGSTQRVRKYSAHTRCTSKAVRRSPQRKLTKTN